MSAKSKPSGADYVAQQSIYDRDGNVLAATGDRCDRVPVESLSWLEQGGHIVKATKTGGDA
jgi:hypothetical protein